MTQRFILLFGHHFARCRFTFFQDFPLVNYWCDRFFSGDFSKNFEVRSRDRPYMLDIYKQVSKFCDCIKIYIFYFGYFLEHIQNAFH